VQLGRARIGNYHIFFPEGYKNTAAQWGEITPTFAKGEGQERLSGRSNRRPEAKE